MMPNLKKLRIERNLSQQKLADAVFVSQQSINQYENHDVQPDFKTLIKLADFFDTTIDYLVGYTEFTEKVNKLTSYKITADETLLINNYRLLNEQQKDSIKLIIANYQNIN